MQAKLIKLHVSKISWVQAYFKDHNSYLAENVQLSQLRFESWTLNTVSQGATFSATLTPYFSKHLLVTYNYYLLSKP
jgi:hypothetical protein